MAKVDYSERQFEMAIHFELRLLGQTSFAPSQVEEEGLGFDGAYYLGLDGLIRLSRQLGDPSISYLLGVSLRKLNDRLETALASDIDYRANIFVQHKKPEFLYGRNAKESGSWPGAYYRYDLTPHQQKALEALAATASGRAWVGYAAPAVKTRRDLMKLERKGGLIDATNFARTQMLNNHKRYSYDAAGCHGCGHSEPEQIEDKPFREQVEAMISEAAGLSLLDHVRDAERSVLAAAEKARASQFLSELKARRDQTLTDDSLLWSMQTVSFFAYWYDLDWILLHGTDRG